MSRARTAALALAVTALPLLVGGWAHQTDPPATEPPPSEPLVSPDDIETEELECGLAAPPDAEFVGEIASIDESLARFRVTRTVQGELLEGSVTVIYGDRQERYLRTGTTYRVEVIRTGLGFTSALTAGECGNNPTTVYADGNPVNTSVLADTRGPLLKYAVLIVVGFLLLIVAVAGLAALANRVRGDGDF